MTTRLIPDETRERLVKLLGMCGSDHDGEVTNAARMADQLVRQSGCVWADLIVMPRPEATHQRRPNGWRAMAIFCSARRDLLNVKERGFVSSMLTWAGELSAKQEKWLTDLFVRCGGAQ